ncbi:nitroreductase family protein [Alkaliphilus peptidifermentans]|uniref:Nitroreductase n=1 Tax=Alkaliphilus peptidifermentans DSM 18978 TaxID=1120976 RepID=A0A1G5GWF4_9FIRM|nr:nitroreductase family protein [Alkaliphilus peptidifermentans]SCY55731.1 Nitroreductase [Alkaliphilus peptidifermentans DSM 18978]
MKREFQAKIVSPDKKGGLTYIEVPFNAAEEFNGKGRIKVQGALNGHTYRSSLISKGNGFYILVIDKKLQKQIGIDDCDTLHVTMEADNIAVDQNVKTPIEKIEKSSMDVLTAIRTRRSIRRFSKKSIDEKVLNTIMEAGFCAPSAKNKRPWHFILVKNKEILKRLAGNDSNHKPISEADCCIVICGDKNIQGMNDFILEDCSAAVQNILLASHGVGIGAVWCGLHTGTKDSKSLTEIFELPTKIVPIAIVALGYPEEDKGAVERFDFSKVHYEKW